IGGDVGEELQIFALALDGKTRWQTANGKAWKKAFPGSRGSCCYSGGMIYQMNAHGRVVCLDAATGKEQWVVDVTKRFGGKRAFFGYSECLLVDGDNLIVTPGGPKALIAALNKKTGETVWASEGPPVAGETAGQASPILLTRGGRRQLIGNTSFRTFAVDAETGNVLWTHGLKLVKNACSTIPVLCGDSVFIINTSAKDQHTALLRIDPSGEKAEEAWTVPLSNPSASALYLDGTLYAAGASRKLEGFVALDVKTGKTTARLPEIKNASAVWAEGKFFVLSADGKALLLKPTAKGFETLGAFPVVENVKKKDAWAHPVLCNGRLYFRYHDELFCYDVKGR
ncbi:PQQ-like beta-propeller repeat protein, partial [bacterium]|nr:PQQ-like beta-propeller repeat protein [bacterium]